MRVWCVKESSADVIKILIQSQNSVCVFQGKRLSVTGECVLIYVPKSPCTFQSCSTTLENQHFHNERLSQGSFKFSQVDFNCLTMMMNGRGYDTESRKMPWRTTLSNIYYHRRGVFLHSGNFSWVTTEFLKESLMLSKEEVLNVVIYSFSPSNHLFPDF